MDCDCPPILASRGRYLRSRRLRPYSTASCFNYRRGLHDPAGAAELVKRRSMARARSSGRGKSSKVIYDCFGGCISQRMCPRCVTARVSLRRITSWARD